MGEALLIYLGLLLLLFMIGMPVGFALGATAIVAGAYQFGVTIPFDMFAQRMVSGINNFTILAVPFFIFAARVMNTSGVTNRLFGFADVCVGWLRGGLGHTNILASMLFAGMSGAAVSDAAGLGMIEIQAMKDNGYDEYFS
ncbi:MAG: TRAP transporter large permease subunit, partial [Clostridia bacterium]|nr:TRAP transporter large permease subunit [Clostridia bacterium]